MMDTILNLGLNDATVEGLARRRPATPRFAYDSLPPLRRDVRRRRARRQAASPRPRPIRSRRILETKKRRARRQRSTPSSTRRRPAASWSPSSRRDRRSATGSDFPDDPLGAALGRDRRGVRLVEQPARRHLPPACTTSPTTGAPPSTCRRWSSATWATTARTGVAFTRDPVDRRAQLLRRVPAQRAGRGRRRRHPHAAADRRASASDGSVARRGHARGVRRARRASTRSSSSTTATCRTSSSRSSSGKLYMLQTRTGKRTGAAMVRIAVEMVNEGADHRGRGGPARRARQARPAAAPDARSQGAASSCSRAGLPASPGRRGRQGRVHRRRGRASGAEQGEAVILVRVETSPEDIHGMKAARGHPHRARRHDHPRGGRRARHGQVLRRRLRRAAASTTTKRRPFTVDDGGTRASSSRRATSSRSTAAPAR